jgi:DNA-binding IclR family transcriptional regulator
VPTAVPALDRAVQILELLRDRPYEAMTLSDIARAADIHKATCASILATMTKHGLVERADGRHYTLGHHLVELGHAYAQRYRPYALGRPDVVRLVADTGLSCATIVRDGEDLVVLDMVGTTAPEHLSMRVGTRVPLVPPVGTIFKAWAGPDELEAWLTAMTLEFGGERATYLGSIAALRSRGYSLGGEHDVNLELESALRRIDADRAGDDRVLEVALIVANKIRNYRDSGRPDDEPVNSVIGPVFDHAGQVVMTLNLYGELGEIRQHDLPALTPKLLDAAARITARTGGRIPAGFPPAGPRSATEAETAPAIQPTQS